MDFETALERYYIMVTEPDVTTFQALEYIKKNTSVEVFKKLLEKVRKPDN